ncbi:MAG: rhodanese-related sulfurtransferase [Flavobacteriaceae bacterium]|mgnify:CR=1 FL=1|jgi:rhodanese-related sulfurtransferase|tara:strand:- start:6953 stop:7291 length:339 start_codon:yes stop_codon:yes gene_type:complete
MKNFLFLLFISLNSQTTSVEVVEKEVYQELMKQDFIIIDVRTPEEYKLGFIKEAILMDYKASDFTASVSALDRNATYLIYCRSGNRSGKASKIMDSLGFSKIYDLKGGYLNW